LAAHADLIERTVGGGDALAGICATVESGAAVKAEAAVKNRASVRSLNFRAAELSRADVPAIAGADRDIHRVGRAAGMNITPTVVDEARIDDGRRFTGHE
jgi:hypothetical protein